MKNMPFCGRRRVYRSAVILIFLGFSVLLTACVVGPGHYGPPPHYHYYPYYQDYYFYPSARVYFHFTTGTYYYLDRTIWVETRVLPAHIRIDASHRVRVRVDADRPYLKFREHSRVYGLKPNYRVDAEQDRKEREANQKWFENFQRKPPSGRKKQRSEWP